MHIEFSRTDRSSGRDIKSSIRVVKNNIVFLPVDAVVNAANEYLVAGGGVCGAIFSAAGAMELQAACMAIGGCRTGNAVITPGFGLDAKYIIHAVGPVWNGGGNGEEELLRSAYMKSLEVAEKNRCSSVAFPLISSGIFGYPKNEAWKVALKACGDYLKDEAKSAMNIVFAVIDDGLLQVGQMTMAELYPKQISLTDGGLFGII